MALRLEVADPCLKPETIANDGWPHMSGKLSQSVLHLQQWSAKEADLTLYNLMVEILVLQMFFSCENCQNCGSFMTVDYRGEKK